MPWARNASSAASCALPVEGALPALDAPPVERDADDLRAHVVELGRALLGGARAEHQPRVVGDPDLESGRGRDESRNADRGRGEHRTHDGEATGHSDRP